MSVTFRITPLRLSANVGTFIGTFAAMRLAVSCVLVSVATMLYATHTNATSEPIVGEAALVAVEVERLNQP